MTDKLKAPDPKQSSLQDREVFWRGVMHMYTDSGIPTGEFCKKRGLSSEAFYRWRRIINRNSDSSHSNDTPSKSTESSAVFSKVKISSDTTSNIPKDETVTIYIGTRIRIDVRSGVNVSFLQSVIEVL